MCYKVNGQFDYELKYCLCRLFIVIPFFIISRMNSPFSKGDFILLNLKLQLLSLLLQILTKLRDQLEQVLKFIQR